MQTEHTDTNSSYPMCVSIPHILHRPTKPLLKQLHWLPILHRTKYNLSLFTHKVIYHNSHDYIFILLSRQLTTNNTITRLSNTFLLDTPILIPTQPVLVISLFTLTTGTHYLPPFVPSHLLAPSNFNSKPNTFLKLPSS